jgi:hypothetical protein
MLANPGMGPNTTINRWIKQILMFHFTLKHVKGATFTPTGLSRHDQQPGDEEYINNEVRLDENPSPDNHPAWDYACQQPLEFDEFKEEIDTRGGYMPTTDNFGSDQSLAIDQERVFMMCS